MNQKIARMRLVGVVFALALSTAFPALAQRYDMAEGLAALISAGTTPYILVDVRTPQEFSSGAIPTAVNIPYDSIVDKPPTADKKALIVVYCRSGSRSSMAESMLRRAGYTNVVNFGGISRWKGEIVKP
jgi:rhodanese-related sulfurtransferase